MPAPPESVEAGKCYLCETGNDPRVRRVIRVLPNGLVQYEQMTRWQKRAQYKDVFAAMASREVPCDWTPEVERE
jgi:hypothetical protein